VANVLENITATCDGLGDVSLSGIKLEEAHRDLLDISKGSLDQHVAMQPAAMAYFLVLKKAAKRRLANAESAQDRWQKKQYAQARAAVESGTTAKSAIKAEDVKARFIIDNEPEIIKWEKRVDKAQAESDTLDAWCEAWKQKSFSLREYVSIEEDERYSSSDSIKGSDEGKGERQGKQRSSGEISKKGIDRVRQVIRKNRARATG
jgi:hypothetical protein